MGTQRNTSDPRQPRQAGQQPDPDDLTDDELDEDTPQPRQPGEQPGSPQS